MYTVLLYQRIDFPQTFQRWLFFSVNTSVRVPHTCSLGKSGGAGNPVCLPEMNDASLL